jgi:hypothetical protein
MRSSVITLFSRDLIRFAEEPSTDANLSRYGSNAACRRAPTRRILTIFLLTWSVAFGPCLRPARTASVPFAVQPSQVGRAGHRIREPNLHAPNLYADKIDFIATLVDLPGSKRKQSYWELSYQLFFVPEESYYETIRRLPQGGSNPTPEEFSGRILLAEGREKKTRLETLKERTITLSECPSIKRFRMRSGQSLLMS